MGQTDATEGGAGRGLGQIRYNKDTYVNESNLKIVPMPVGGVDVWTRETMVSRNRTRKINHILLNPFSDHKTEDSE